MYVYWVIYKLGYLYHAVDLTGVFEISRNQ